MPWERKTITLETWGLPWGLIQTDEPVYILPAGTVVTPEIIDEMFTAKTEVDGTTEVVDVIYEQH